MRMMVLSAPAGAALLLVPALIFACLGLMRDAPGDWGQGALIAWSAVCAALIGGAGLAAGPLGLLAPLLGFGAIMLGGPPGLAVAALALGATLLTGAGPGVARWLVVALALLPAGLALRRGIQG